MDSYDVAILGAGPGGYVAAIRGAQLGAKVCVIERDEVGGTCLNWGCIPTKTLIASVRALETARGGEEYGFGSEGGVSARFERMMDRKDEVVSRQVKGIQSLLKRYGVMVYYGNGKLVDTRTVEIMHRQGSRDRVAAEKIILATGSRPSGVPGVDIDGDAVLSSNEALALREVPKSLLVIGAGAVGCEFASLFHGLGSDVTMVELLPRAVPMEDAEISQTLERELKKQRIKLIVQTSVQSVARQDGGRIVARLAGGREIAVDKVLVSVGRAFNVDGIGLETVGIAKGQRGEIVVDEKLETSVEGIYAIGDVIGGMMLAHVASREGIVAVENALGGDERIDYSAVPACIFSHPEIASVGLKEKEAVDKGRRVRVGRFQMRGVGMAHALGELSGFMKVIADADTDHVLGVHMIGSHVTEIVHEAVLALQARLTAGEWAKVVHAHPTMSEALQEAIHDLRGSAIHAPPKGSTQERRLTS